MTHRVRDAVANGACDAAVDQVDVGSTNANGVIEFYTGSPPAALGDSTTETRLVTVACQDPAFGDAGAGGTAGIATLNGLPLESTGDADGDIGWARIVDRDGNAVWDEDDVSTSDSSAITVNTTTVSVGVAFEVTGYDYSARP